MVIIKKRARLAPVRLESEYPLSDMTQRVLAKRLKLKRNQIYSIGMPLDMGYAFALPSLVPADVREDLVDEPASPQWPASVVPGTAARTHSPCRAASRCCRSGCA